MVLALDLHVVMMERLQHAASRVASDEAPGGDGVVGNESVRHSEADGRGGAKLDLTVQRKFGCLVIVDPGAVESSTERAERAKPLLKCKAPAHNAPGEDHRLWVKVPVKNHRDSGCVDYRTT